MNATAHPAPETLLLFALGRDIPAPTTSAEEATLALLAHAEACPPCADALDAALAAASLERAVSLERLASLPGPAPSEADSTAEEAEAAPSRLSTRDAILSPTATSAAALRAAAADARAFEAPPAPALAGTARLPSGESASIFRRPGEPPTFAIDRRELFGRAVRLSGADGGDAEAASVRLDVDRFGRLRLEAPAALALERRLARGERLAIEPL